MTVAKMIKKHLPLVREFNRKFGKEKYIEEVEYCLYMEEYAELCEAYRKKDCYKLFDTLVDLYYYEMYRYSGEQSFPPVAREPMRSSKPLRGYYNFDMLCYTDWGFGEYAPYMVLSLGYTLQDFDDYFSIVHMENIAKVETVDGKVQKGAKRKEKDKQKKKIVDRVKRKFS